MMMVVMLWRLTEVNVEADTGANTEAGTARRKARLGPPLRGGYQKHPSRPSSAALLRRGFIPAGFSYNDIEEH